MPIWNSMPGGPGSTKLSKILATKHRMNAARNHHQYSERRARPSKPTYCDRTDEMAAAKPIILSFFLGGVACWLAIRQADWPSLLPPESRTRLGVVAKTVHLSY